MNKLEKKIKRLSTDKSFGILTRNALEEELRDKQVFDCLFIDLCNIKSLNNLLGYEKVNELIKDMLDEFKTIEQCIIGRWFSGDEIVIVTANVNKSATILKQCGRNHNISFKHKILTRVMSLGDLEHRIGLNTPKHSKGKKVDGK